ncbi:MAG: cohesin domain-containing protein [Nitrospiraceae bacterium]|nr:cohesin domain-containing protein [Nitrospiraceae bacterium]
MKRFGIVLLTVVLLAGAAGCAGSRAFQRGEQYAKRGDWDLAVKEYRDALKSSPQDIEYRSALLRAEETAANEHYKRAKSFLKERKLDQAIVELQQAIYLNPTNAAIQSALKSVLNMKQAEEHYRAALTFMELNRLADATTELGRAVDLDPENLKYQDALDKLNKKRSEVEPEDALTLASDKPITLNFKNTNIKEVFELLSKLSGINILFDEEVKAQPVTIFVKDVSFQYALNLLLSTNKLFMKKISADTIIIIPKTKAKMDQYQDLVMKTFYLNNAKSKDIVNLLRSMLDTKKVYVNEVLNSITVRDTPEKMKLVEKVISANDLKEAEVILDVEILEISRTKSLQYGWSFQPGLQVGAQLGTSTTAVGTTAQGTTVAGTATSSAVFTLKDLQNMNSSNVMLSLPTVLLRLIKQDSDAQTLANPRVRVLNNKQAKFHIGDKIPVQTSTVQSTATVAVTSTFEYKDVGIKLNIEPTIHLNNTVTLKMSLEISSLGDAIDFGNGQKQYKFGTRNTDTTINLRDGETVIIGGLIKDEERRAENKIPLLGDIPILGKLFSSSDDGTVKTDILMSITPNIVRGLEVPDKDSQSFWSGTEEAFDVKPLFVTNTAKSSKPAPEKPIDKTAILDQLARREQPAPLKPGEAKEEGPVSLPTVTGEQAAATVELKPADATSAVGQDIRFDIAATNVKDLYGAILTLSYDPKVMDFKSAAEGDFLKKDGQQTSFLFSSNIKAGTVDLYITRIGDVGGVMGTGTLGTVVFQGKAAGQGPVTVKSVKLSNFNREPIKTSLKGAQVVVK